MRTVEITLWVVGALLIAAYFLARGHGDLEARQGIAAFEDVRAVALASLEAPPEAVVAERPTDRPPEGRNLSYTPDHDDWAEYRVRLYERDAATARSVPSALVRIPGIGLEVPVYEEYNERNLNRGVAHIPGTAPLGATGNVGIAGHRDSFFRGLQHVEIGDVIEVEGMTGSRSYRITDLSIVEPTEVSVLDATESAVVTLVTCYPFYFAGHAPQRFIVRAEAVTDTTP